MISRSTDDGLTWSDWKDAQGDINSFNSGKLQGYDRGFAASGTGSRINNGTLMGAMMINNDNFSNPAAAVIVSTDNGYNWKVRSIAKRKSGTQDEPKVVTQLNDGRILVVEYKGQHIVDNADTREKNNIGKLWESKSNGKGLFSIVQKTKDGLNVDEQLNAIIGD